MTPKSEIAVGLIFCAFYLALDFYSSGDFLSVKPDHKIQSPDLGNSRSYKYWSVSAHLLRYDFSGTISPLICIDGFRTLSSSHRTSGSSNSSQDESCGLAEAVPL
jgi:hypothetical protein